MILSTVGVPSERIQIRNGDVEFGGRVLSVAEIQQAFRELRTRTSEAASTPGTVGSCDPVRDRGSVGARAADLERDWVAVVAAHAGAGASTIALAIADAACTAGRTAHLVETAHPTRSGLVGAATAELGLDAGGTWRRGSRGQVTIHRRAGNDTTTGWPAVSVSDEGLVVIDLGLPVPESVARLSTLGCRIVIACRPTVPGVRLAEELLNSLTGGVIVAAVGAGRWPGEVSASLGPRLRVLRAAGAVVTVPTDARLEVTGPTTSPLPKPVAAAGRSLLRLIDAAQPGAIPASARPAPYERGTDR